MRNILRYHQWLALIAAIAALGACGRGPPPLNHALDILVADGIFDATWGEPYEDFVGRANLQGETGEPGTFMIRTGQELFDVTRSDDDWIQYVFGDAGLHTIRVTFPTCLDVPGRLVALFGEPNDNTGAGNLGVWRGALTTLSVDRIEDGDCIVTFARMLPSAKSRRDQFLELSPPQPA